MSYEGRTWSCGHDRKECDGHCNRIPMVKCKRRGCKTKCFYGDIWCDNHQPRGCRVSESHEQKVFAALQGKFKHYCWEWDGMAIDETCREFQCCTCAFGPLQHEVDALQGKP